MDEYATWRYLMGVVVLVVGVVLPFSYMAYSNIKLFKLK
jgi:hypothetical protein